MKKDNKLRDRRAKTWNAYYGVTTGYYSRTVVPDGWRLPTTRDFEILIHFLYPNTLAPETFTGADIKEAGNTHWLPSTQYILNSVVTNKTGFTALPAGYAIIGNGNLAISLKMGELTRFWTTNNLYMSLSNQDNNLYTATNSPGGGNWLFSIRLIKK
jgi:uncharacterized protein (TIGR02145 family)